MKTILKIAGVVTVLTCAPAFAQHAGHGAHAPKGPSAPNWTSYPVLASGGGFSRAGGKYQTFNMHAMESTVWGSYDGRGEEDLDNAAQSLTPDENGAVSFKAMGTGGYYLLRVMGHGPNGEIATATTVKYFSNPGPAPRDLLNAARPGFEIVPNPLPREHGHYRENETWTFQVRRDGKPVTYRAVVLQTSNGSQVELVTDDQGLVAVTFPQDTPEIPKAQWNHGRPPASAFVLAVKDGGLLATYNDTYNRDALAGKSVWTGVGFVMLGMAAAFPIVRRRKSK